MWDTHSVQNTIATCTSQKHVWRKTEFILILAWCGCVFGYGWVFWCGYVQSGVHDCVYTPNNVYPNPKMLKTKHLVVHEGLNEEYVKRCWWLHIHHLIISILVHTHTYTIMLYIHTYAHIHTSTTLWFDSNLRKAGKARESQNEWKDLVKWSCVEREDEREWMSIVLYITSG